MAISDRAGKAGLPEPGHLTPTGRKGGCRVDRGARASRWQCRLQCRNSARRAVAGREVVGGGHEGTGGPEDQGPHTPGSDPSE